MNMTLIIIFGFMQLVSLLGILEIAKKVDKCRKDMRNIKKELSSLKAGNNSKG